MSAVIWAGAGTGGLEDGISPHTKGLPAGEAIKAFCECSQDGLTCVAGTTSGCVELCCGAWAPSNEVRVVMGGFDAGRCGASWNLFTDDLGLAGGPSGECRVPIQDCDIGAHESRGQARTHKEYKA